MLEAGCHRSHPHEDMDAICKLKTENAQLKAELAQLKTDRDEWKQSAQQFNGLYESLQAELAKLKEGA